MLERELKFHVPGQQRAALEQELLGLDATRLPLHARYFDTEKNELAKAKIALRLRKEGEQWVQTIKAPGPDELSRIEINHDRPEPTLDLSLYQGGAMEQLMAQLEYPLQLRYETLVDRLLVQQAGETGVVELAYDQGIIKAGTLELPLCELELELVSGSTDFLFTLARPWLKKHNLVLDLRSKAERGELLARIAATAAPQAPDDAPMRKPRRAGTITLTGAASLDAAYRLCANDCLNQIIRNACFLAGVDSPAAGPARHVEYVHQLRVGIRRIRSCWRFFSKWVAIDETALGSPLKHYFSLLGQTRDADVIKLAITPRLRLAGMPELTLPTLPAQADQAQALAASAPFQAILLTLLEHLVAADTATQDTQAPPAAREPGQKAEEKEAGKANASKKLGKTLSRQLNKRLKRLCRQGAQFDQLPVAQQHNLRKRIKALRYSVEFSASLLTAKSFARLRTALETTQHTLGELNDFYVAHDYYQPLSATHPQAMFAAGWLRAMQEQKIIQAQADIARLAKAGRFKWRRSD